jgi:hypothetical protein
MQMSTRHVAIDSDFGAITLVAKDEAVAGL